MTRAEVILADIRRRGAFITIAENGGLKGWPAHIFDPELRAAIVEAQHEIVGELERRNPAYRGAVAIAIARLLQDRGAVSARRCHRAGWRHLPATSRNSSLNWRRDDARGGKWRMRLGEDQREQALAWLEEGESSGVVAQKIGCSIRTVQRIAHDLATRPENSEQSLKEAGYIRPPAPDRGELDASGGRSHFTRATLPHKTCAAVTGVFFLGASVALTGTMQLAATDRERRDIGAALADALEFLPKTSLLLENRQSDRSVERLPLDGLGHR